ncbi:hypothetical protein [Brevibacterium limosum]|uniref:hypothetical protein n=1 Tax=Brevibacterium limosum TaxID=2697565 RepID=UPI00141F714E|nr:hypothetical protein [Brevibacterium limosum]
MIAFVKMYKIALVFNLTDSWSAGGPIAAWEEPLLVERAVESEGTGAKKGDSVSVMLREQLAL